jgi:hypothetical protein
MGVPGLPGRIGGVQGFNATFGRWFRNETASPFSVRWITSAALMHVPYIRDEEIFDSIETHVFKRVARIYGRSGQRRELRYTRAISIVLPRMR